MRCIEAANQPNFVAQQQITIPRQSRGLSSCEPLKAAEGTLPRPRFIGLPIGSRSAPQSQLIQSLILLLLALDIFSDQSRGGLQKTSNFYGHPGKAGGTLDSLGSKPNWPDRFREGVRRRPVHERRRRRAGRRLRASEGGNRNYGDGLR